MIEPVRFSSVDDDLFRVQPLFEVLLIRLSMQLFCLNLAKKIMEAEKDSIHDQEERSNESHKKHEEEKARLAQERRASEVRQNQIKKSSRLSLPYQGRFLLRQSCLLDMDITGSGDLLV